MSGYVRKRLVGEGLRPSERRGFLTRSRAKQR